MTHRNSVVQEHTKKFHEYVEQYYMKLLSSGRAVEQVLRNIYRLKSQPLPDETVTLSLFYLARYTKLEEAFYQQGILMLRDFTAEVLLQSLSWEIETRLFGDGGLLSHEADATIREHIALYEPLTQFKVKTGQGQVLHQATSDYRQRISQIAAEDVRGVILRLYCWRVLFSFEINMVYQPWYGAKPQKPSLHEPGEPLTGEDVSSFLTNALSGLETEKRISREQKKGYLYRIGLKSS